MITTAVQQGPQMVEVQGAPAPIPATGDEFRATFAASVSGAAAQKPTQTAASSGVTAGSGAASQSGSASARHVLLAGLVAKSSSLAASGALQDVPGPEGAGSQASTSLASLKAVPEGSLKSATADDLPADMSSTEADSGLGSAALAAAAIVLKTQGAVSSNLQVAAASGPDTSAGVAKNVTAQATDSAVVRGRKEVAVSGKEASAPALAPSATSAPGCPLPITALALPVAQLDTAALAQARTPDGVSIAEPGTKWGVLTGVLEASGGASGFHGSPVLPVSGDEVPDAAPEFHPWLNDSASLQQATLAGAAATAASESSIRNASAKDGPWNASIVAEVQTAARDGSSAASGSIAAAASVVSGADLKPVASTAQTKSVSAGSGVGGKTSAAVETTGAAAVTQARAIAPPHSASNVKSRIGAQPTVPGATGTVTTKPPTADGENLASSAVPASVVAAAAGGPATTTQAEVKLAQPPDALRDVAGGTVELTEASSRAGTAAAKDEKTKNVSAGSDDAASTQSAARSLTGDTSNAALDAAASVSANLAAAVNAAGRVVPVADVVIPVTQAVAHVAAATARDVGALAGSAASGRALGAVSSGSISETGYSGAQIGEPHRTLLATPTTLEVGVPGGTQGWLRIRAEVGGPGEVNASLTAASSGAREALHSQMPALNAFLHSEQIAVTATVADRGASSAGGGQEGAGLGSGGLGSGGLGSGGLGSGGLGGDGSNGSNASLLQGGGARGGSEREAVQPPTSVSANEAVRSYDSRGGVSEVAGTLAGSTARSEESGRWLNVRV